MTNWGPAVCDCVFTLNNNVLVSAVKGAQHGHNAMSDQAAYNDAVALCLAQPTPIPQSVTPYQLKRALLETNNLLATVEQAVAGADPVTQLAWSEAVSFQRTDALLLAMAQLLNISSETLDDLFILAASYD